MIFQKFEVGHQEASVNYFTQVIQILLGNSQQSFLLVSKKFITALLHVKQIQGVPTKGINKKLLIGVAHDFNPQFLNLFGFSISVSFVWITIQEIWMHLVNLQQFLGDVRVF